MSEGFSTGTRETPVFFPAGPETVFGVVTEPVGDALGIGAIAMMGGGFQSSAHANRFAVHLARRLAEQGYHAMRVDYRGVGESGGSLKEYRLDQPFLEEVQGSVQFLQERGVDRFLLVGTCVGGRTALAAASNLPGVVGVVLVTTPLTDLRMREGTAYRRTVDTSVWRFLGRGLRWRNLRRFFPPYSFRRQRKVALAHLRVGARVGWRRLSGRLSGEADDVRELNPRVLRDLESLVGRRVPVLLVFGERDPFRGPFRPGASRRLSRLVSSAGPLLEVQTVPGERAHRLVAGQERTIEVVVDWLGRQKQDRAVSVAQGG